MSLRALLVLSLACAGSARAQVARAPEASWAAAPFQDARAALAARPEAFRSALVARLRRNPVAAEFAVPTLERDDSVSVEFRGESEDPGLKGVWACYKRDRRLLIFNRDALNEDFAGRGVPALAAGALPDARQTAEIAGRFLPVIVHEIGGHARHYAELARLLGKPAPNARETETSALRLEAMAIAAERKADPAYLRDESAYAKGESVLADKYWEYKIKRDPSLFADFVAAVPAYGKIPSAAAGPVADYYRNEESSLRAADARLIGDSIPDDETGIGRRETFPDGGRFRR